MSRQGGRRAVAVVATFAFGKVDALSKHRALTDSGRALGIKDVRVGHLVAFIET